MNKDPKTKIGTEPEWRVLVGRNQDGFDWKAAGGFITAVVVSAVIAILAIVGLVTLVT